MNRIRKYWQMTKHDAIEHAKLELYFSQLMHRSIYVRPQQTPCYPMTARLMSVEMLALEATEILMRYKVSPKEWEPTRFVSPEDLR
jgi:hypothetical protein